MCNKNDSILLLLLTFLFTTPNLGLAATVSDSWIFRSEVAQGQSMWGPGSYTNYNFSDKYTFDAGMFKAGFEWALQADRGTVSGNVERTVTARYSDTITKPGKTNLQLSYAGINNESQISASFGAALTTKPSIAVDLPWPLPDINHDFLLNPVDVNANAMTDFTTGLDKEVAA